MDIKSFVFLDLEATGLPNLENHCTKITEMCMISVQTEHILLGAVPRVQNKLNLCFNPWRLILPTVERITGLSNDLLEQQSSFDEKTFAILTNFLERLQKPICFVAHNGLGFDYPVLKYHLEKISNNFISHIFCIDSLHAFRNILNKPLEAKSEKNECEELDLSDEWDNSLVEEVLHVEESFIKSTNVENIQRRNETTPLKKVETKVKPVKPFKQKIKLKSASESILPYLRKGPEAKKRLNFDDNLHQSFKLPDVYKRLLQRVPVNAHHAEADVNMILECAVFLGEKFVNWANNNARLFTEISKMQPKIVHKQL